MAYSQEIRNIVLRMSFEGKMTIEKISHLVGIGTDTVSRWKREHGQEKKVHKKRGSKLCMSKDVFLSYVEQHPDLTTAEYGSYFKVSQMTISNYFKRYGLTFKKNNTVQRS